MSAEAIRREIERLTTDLISTGLCIDQNFPSLRTEADAILTVGFSGLEDLSFTLKNVPYAETYARLVEARSFNIKLIDGGMLQMLYTFKGNSVLKHRLTFFPSPDLLHYQNSPEIYDDDELYGDIVFKNVVTVPVRFDYDPKAFIDIDHPRSHMTLGQYKNCRIAVSGPVSPFYFLIFILRSFYNSAFRNFCEEIRQGGFLFGETITENESSMIHVRLRHVGVHDQNDICA